MTCDVVEGGRGRAHTAPAREAEGRCHPPHAPVSLGTLALIEDGSQKRVKDTKELAKMVDTKAPEKGLDVRSHRKFRAEHLN